MLPILSNWRETRLPAIQIRVAIAQTNAPRCPASSSWPATRGELLAPFLSRVGVRNQNVNCKRNYQNGSASLSALCVSALSFSFFLFLHSKGKAPKPSSSEGAFLPFWPQPFLVVSAVKVEQIKQVADRRRILRQVRIVVIHTWIWQIVSAASADCRQVPVPFDELQNRNVVRVVVRNVARLGERRNHDQRNARPVSEKVQRLHVSGIVVTSTFVRRDKNRCA